MTKSIINKTDKGYLITKHIIKRLFLIATSIGLITLALSKYSLVIFPGKPVLQLITLFVLFIIFWNIVQHLFGIPLLWKRLYYFQFWFCIVIIHSVSVIIYYKLNYLPNGLMDHAVGYGSILINIITMFLVKIFYLDVKIKNDTDYNSHATNTNAEDPPNIQWIKDDSPICDSSSEYCTVGNAVQHTYDLLLKESPTSVGIVGSYGAGKTSTVYMVSNRLQEADNDNMNIVCIIDAWGREIKSLDKQIIAKMINTMKSYIDISKLLFIPQRYSASLSDSHWFVRLLLTINSERYETDKIIGRIDDLLEMYNKRMILFVEDIDRNHLSPSTSVNIYALFDRLKKCSNISVIITINASSVEPAALNRICNHIIGLSLLQVDFGRQVWYNFRQYCLTSFENDVPLQRPDESAENIGLYLDKEYQQRYAAIHALLGDTDEPVTIIIHLIKSIRILKLILRETWDAWQELHGEVNFDDLLYINIIKISIPDLYNYMIDNYNKFTHKPDTNNILGEERESITKKRKEEVESILPTDLNISKKEVHKLITFLFPEWSGDFDSSTLDSQRVTMSKFGQYYWNRIIAGRINENEVKDQVLLKDITAYQTGKLAAESLAQKLFESEQYSEHFEKFGQRLSRPKLNRLTLSLLLLGLEKYKSKANFDSITGCSNLWRLSLDINCGDDYYKNILKWLDVISNDSLALSNDIFSYWENTDHYDVRIKQPQPKFLSEYYNLLKKKWEYNHKILLNSLNTDIIYSLYYTLILFPNKHHYYQYLNIDKVDVINMGAATKKMTDVFCPKEFKWLCPILMKCVKTDKQKIIPFILNIVARKEKWDDKIGRYKKFQYYQINHAAAEQWLGEKNWGKIMQQTLTLDPDYYKNSNKILPNLIRDSKSTAKEYLKNKQSTKKTT